MGTDGDYIQKRDFRIFLNAGSTGTHPTLNLYPPLPGGLPASTVSPLYKWSCHPLLPTFRTLHGCPLPTDDDLLVPPLWPSGPSSHYTHAMGPLLSS